MIKLPNQANQTSRTGNRLPGVPYKIEMLGFLRLVYNRVNIHYSFGKEKPMNPSRKVFITVLSFVLAMTVIACSCSTLIPTATSQQETMPGLAGTWESPNTGDVYEIAWQGGKYVVLSAVYSGNNYDITSQSWSGSSLTWSYYDTDLALTVTLQTTSLVGDSLYVNVSLSDGTTVATNLNRVP
jgi:hypothetical protein